MSKRGMALHAHSYSITTDTYKNSLNMSKEMTLVQTDTWQRPSDNKTIEFINMMEGKNYPFFSMMYHPEY
jgi:carbamoylphosphate synthase small subunit